ncbi:MAG: hypothetical protein A2787_02035 [Omnitrophica WOR_2 bacterium RIFCSPHIGHO2_01_FULL_48_9]|nr:MAG: hypothetical protein A3D10_01755 [Omnitrophica WOR_2 bacterium RIFCSPHIGHO2_02_FULL_48_11]OGX34399.1 MAG: hypothetical protein A2787_02035 [Omnitrophica WOR_2 bacterium RIFCSPHIGHO2_01_FULL_48_9]
MDDKTLQLRRGFDSSDPDFGPGIPFWRHEYFSDVLAQEPLLEKIVPALPKELNQKIFAGQPEIEKLWSSYKDHGYGHLFYQLIRCLKPAQCVEIGVLQGFSLLTVAAALRDNGRGKISGFDLFEQYPYHHESFENVDRRIKNFNLQSIATIARRDAFAVHEQFVEVDYLHVDISNNGDTYRKIFEQWAPKVKKVMLLEGGSVKRDVVEWMIKYKKPSITKALDEFRLKYPDWNIVVFDPYPSLTLAVRKNSQK